MNMMKNFTLRGREEGNEQDVDVGRVSRSSSDSVDDVDVSGPFVSCNNMSGLRSTSSGSCSTYGQQQQSEISEESGERGQASNGGRASRNGASSIHGTSSILGPSSRTSDLHFLARPSFSSSTTSPAPAVDQPVVLSELHPKKTKS
eukprot:GSA25T00022379001.1